MLVVVTVLCVLLGLKVKKAERQKAVVAWVEKIGGRSAYDYEADDNGHFYFAPQKPNSLFGIWPNGRSTRRPRDG